MPGRYLILIVAFFIASLSHASDRPHGLSGTELMGGGTLQSTSEYSLTDPKDKAIMAKAAMLGKKSGDTKEIKDDNYYQRPQAAATVGEGLTDSTEARRLQKLYQAQALLAVGLASNVTWTENPISWYYTLEEGKKLAAKKTIPYAVYVCAQPAYAVAGEGLTGWQEYKKQHNGAAPEYTLFEYREIHEALKTAGVTVLVKLEYKKETMEQMEQLGAVPGMLFLFAPNGERLEKFLPSDCTTTNVINYLKGDFKDRLAAWKTRQEFLQSLEAPAPDKK